MNGITHRQAKRYMRADLDELLDDAQRRALETHLAGCEACRAESQSLSSLTARLQTEFHARWDAQDGPSEHVLANIQSQSRRIIMSNRINVVFRTLVEAAVFAIFIWGINYVVAQIRANAAGEIRVTALPLQTESNLIAFTAEQNGNAEIYTMHADGSGVINLTNNLANDYNPAWSPDGQKIAFISERTGNADIFIMNLDGSGLTQLTDDPGHDGFFSWSPTGEKIIYLAGEKDINIDGQLIIMSSDGRNKTFLTGRGSYVFLGWSPDGQKVVYQKQNSDEGVQSSELYVMNTDGTQKQVWNVAVDSIKWTDNQHFLGYGWNEDGETPEWLLLEFNTNGGAPAELASSDMPILYVLPQENNEVLFITRSSVTSWSWWQVTGTVKSFITTWDYFSDTCQNPNAMHLGDDINKISSDGGFILLSVNCAGRQQIHLINADGASFGIPVSTDFDFSSIYDIGGWSPDGKFFLMGVSNAQSGTDLYLFDIESLLTNPSTKPIRLTSDASIKFEAVWQPFIENKTTEEKPTP